MVSVLFGFVISSRHILAVGVTSFAQKRILFALPAHIDTAKECTYVEHMFETMLIIVSLDLKKKRSFSVTRFLSFVTGNPAEHLFEAHVRPTSLSQLVFVFGRRLGTGVSRRPRPPARRWRHGADGREWDLRDRSFPESLRHAGHQTHLWIGGDDRGRTTCFNRLRRRGLIQPKPAAHDRLPAH